MKGFDVLKVKSAVKSRNKFDLSFSHLTTMDFGEIVPLFAREMVPGDEFKVRGDYFSRMAPLVKPTYGKFQFKTVAGFVPYHQVAYDADSWIAGKSSLEGLTTRFRYFTVQSLHSFLYTMSTGSGATASNCDYTFINGSGIVNYRLFTHEGKYFVKILNALGYALPQGVDEQTTSSWYTTVRNVKLSAYPFLAFFKLYNDYMSQSQRFNTSALSEALMKVKNGIATTGYVPTTGEINHALIKLCFDNLFLNYENDYFTSAWQQANNPINNNEGISAIVPSQSQGEVEFNVSDNYLVLDIFGNSPQQYTNLGQRALDFLQSFDNWVRRNNYSGSRDVQQIYSRFGIKIEDYKTRYAHIITTDSMPIQVGDVTSTADTSSAFLGDYAGKGIMNGSKDVYYKSSDYGMLFIFGYFTVTPMNAYGYDRQVLRNSPLDFYTPEFDGIGGDAISLGEVYASPLAAADSDTTLDTSIFGFTERYNNYRYGRDVITGEFRDYRNNGDMNTWHTGRNLSVIRKAGNLVAQSSSMNTLEKTDSQYNRIFSVTTGDVNHFYLTARFSVDAIRPMLNLNQVVRLGEGDTNVPRNGNVIN